jgi:hypothetical protein
VASELNPAIPAFNFLFMWHYPVCKGKIDPIYKIYPIHKVEPIHKIDPINRIDPIHKVDPIYKIKAHRGVKVQLFSFSTSALNTVNGQLYTLVALPPGQEPPVPMEYQSWHHSNTRFLHCSAPNHYTNNTLPPDCKSAYQI